MKSGQPSQGERAPRLPSPRPAREDEGIATDQLFRILVDSLSDASVVVFDHELVFLHAGGSALTAAGLDPTALVGRRLADVMPPSSVARLEGPFRRALAGEDVAFEHESADGERQYRVRVRPLHDDGGTVLAGMVVTQEVTALHHTNLALQRSQARAARLFAQAPVGMIVTEPGPEGAVLDVNSAFAELFDATRDEVMSWTKEQILVKLTPEARRSSEAVTAGHTAGQTYDTTLLSLDGAERTLRVTIRVVDDPDGKRVISQLVDVSDQRRAEVDLREALAFQSAVLSVIPDSVHVADAELGTHVWASRDLAHDLGHSSEALAQLAPTGEDLVHPDDRDALRDTVRQVAEAADGEVVHLRHRALAADGSLRWIDRRKSPLNRHPDGSVAQYASIARDITDQVNAEEALRSALAFQETVLTTTPDIVSVFDVNENKTVWVSRSLTDLMGYDLEAMQALQATGMSSLLHPDDLAASEAFTQEVTDLPDGQVGTTNTRVRHVNGSWRILSRRSTPFLRDPTGAVVQVLNVARDITDQIAAEKELEQARALQQAVISTSPDLIVLVEAATGVPTWASRPFEELLGWSHADLLSFGPHPFTTLVHADDRAGLAALEAELLTAEDGQVVHARFRARHRDGSHHWLSRRMVPFERDAAGVLVRYLVIVRDVTEVVDAERALQHAALHDPLTGLPNRALVADRLRSAVAATRRGGRVGVLFLDLDGFKRINDAHGHAAGDAVLQVTSDRLLLGMRAADTVGRMGGDEFVVIVVPQGNEDVEELAAHVAERLRSAVADPVEFADLEYTVTASIGVAYAGSHDDAEAVLRDADCAMYRAKTSGKDRIAVFDPEQRAGALNRAALERALRHALTHDLVEVHFQPLVRTATSQLEGVEALLRVRGDDGQFLDTQEAVLVAEQTGLMAEVGAVVLRKACTQAVVWNDGLRVAVNLSAHEIARPGLFERVTKALDGTGLAAGRLVLELTETVLLEAAKSTVNDLERLRGLGIGIAIDDFGTGYASLRYLATLPVTCVKVDRSFTAGLGLDPVSSTLVRATIGLARDLGLECVVEGVETREQLAALGHESHVVAQGYLLGRPAAPPETAAALLN